MAGTTDPGWPTRSSRRVERRADRRDPRPDAASGYWRGDALGLGESDAPVWVSCGGRFSNGVLRGAWHKPAAAFIGHGAREAARAGRLAELERAAPRCSAELAALGRDRRARPRAHAAGRELTELPSDGGPRDGQRACRLEAELAALARRLDDARASERKAPQRGHGTRCAALANAADLGLPPDRGAGGVEAALGSFAGDARRAVARLSTALARRAGASVARQGRRSAARELWSTPSGAWRTEAEHQLAAAVERRDTLRRPPARRSPSSSAGSARSPARSPPTRRRSARHRGAARACPARRRRRRGR